MDLINKNFNGTHKTCSKFNRINNNKTNLSLKIIKLNPFKKLINPKIIIKRLSNNPINPKPIKMPKINQKIINLTKRNKIRKKLNNKDNCNQTVMIMNNHNKQILMALLI